MSLPEMQNDSPKHRSIGVKTSSKSYPQHWRGFKPPLDVADGQIPIGAVLTEAKVHDSRWRFR